MKKKLLITLIMASLALTACGAKEKTETNESQQAQVETTENASQQQKETQTQTVVSEKDMLLEINNWIVGDVWNKGFCDFYHYEEDGTSSTGESIDIEFALSQFKENYKKKDEYNSYIHSLSNNFENIINIWDKLIKEADTLYAHYENGVEQTGTSADTAIFTQYRDAFSDEINNLNIDEHMEKTQESKNSSVSVNKETSNVVITIPANFVESSSQEDLNKICKDKGFESIMLNEDGSATYTMSKKQHKELLSEYDEQINNSLSEMIGSQDYPNFTNIEANNNFTEFTVTTKNTELDMNESFSVMAFYMYGGLYGVFSGDEPDNILVTFINADSGEVIDTANSSDME